MFVALYKEDAAQASILHIMDTTDGTVDAVEKSELCKICNSSMFENVQIKNDRVELIRYKNPVLDLSIFDAKLEDVGDAYMIYRGSKSYKVEKEKVGIFEGIDIEGTKLKYYFLNRIKGNGYCIESFA